MIEYLKAADKLRRYGVLISAGYNNLNEETFAFYWDSFRTCADQLDMLKALDTALNFIKTRDRPWSVIVFRSLDKSDSNDNDCENERRLFGPSVKTITALYAGDD